MSFLFNSRPQLSSAEKIAAAETEAELMMDMYNRYFSLLPLQHSKLTTGRLSQSCTRKCIPPEYREGELNKGESVCLDRCVSKFFEANLKVGEKMQGDMQARAGAGGMFGA